MSSEVTKPRTIEDLKAGNERYLSGQGLRHDARQAPKQAEGQLPHVLVVSCADSRVIPEILFDAGIGELFVCRVAGNVATSETIASLEYAVAHIPTEPKVLVVLGHQACGAVGAAMGGGLDNSMEELHLRHLVRYIEPAIEHAGGRTATQDAVIEANASLTAQRLVRDSAILRAAASAGKLHVHAAYYHLTGKVDFLPSPVA